MIIKIDCRENDLHILCINIVSFNKYSIPIKIQSENIPLGDVIICDDSGNEIVIIERKTLNDLASSICDGRYKEQSFRLNECNIHNHNVYYLIEGPIKSYKSHTRIDKRSIISSMISISHFKGFSIHKTNDIQESVEWIIQFAEKIGKQQQLHPFYKTIETSSSSSSSDTIENVDQSVSYCQTMKRVKKNNITPENIGEIMLSQIPNVSASTAIIIMREFKTILSLITSLQNDEKCLDHLKIDNGKEPRKINKNSILSIRKYLLQ